MLGVFSKLNRPILLLNLICTSLEYVTILVTYIQRIFPTVPDGNFEESSRTKIKNENRVEASPAQRPLDQRTLSHSSMA